MSGLMNKIKSATGGQSNDPAQSTGGQANTGTTGQAGQAQAGGQQEDYGDKGLDALERKKGINLSREQNERITDTGRQGFESVTGKDIPDKFSN